MPPACLAAKTSSGRTGSPARSVCGPCRLPPRRSSSVSAHPSYSSLSSDPSLRRVVAYACMISLRSYRQYRHPEVHCAELGSGEQRWQHAGWLLRHHRCQAVQHPNPLLSGPSSECCESQFLRLASTSAALVQRRLGQRLSHHDLLCE